MKQLVCRKCLKDIEHGTLCPSCFRQDSKSITIYLSYEEPKIINKDYVRKAR